jgi:hypothetical protein
MFQVSNTKLAALAAVAITLASTLPSFAWDNHPRRREVLNRDNNINRQINNNRGNLGGHFGQLKAEDRQIRNQERREFRNNGGHLTRGQQKQLNREENHVQRQVNRDKHL